MICPNCSHNNREGAKFCEECGIVLPSGSAAAYAPMRAQSAIPRRAAPLRPNPPPPIEPSDPQPSGTTMLGAMASMNSARARQILALAALAVVVLLLCSGCAIAGLTLYVLTQNQGMALVGMM